MRMLRRRVADLTQPRQGLLVDPAGQILVLNYESTLTAAEADRIKAHMRAEYPGLVVLITCADNISVQPKTAGCG